MVGVIAGIAGVAVLAALVYLGRERLGARGVGLAALRTVGLGALLVLLVNPAELEPGGTGPVTVLLDASLSQGAAGGRWRAALDTARALAGADGTILRFGDGTTPFDTAPPADPATRLEPALRAAAGRGGPVWIVTDGEIADGLALPPALRRAAGFVLLPRDTVADAALLDVVLDERALPGDSIGVTLEIGTWGPLSDTVAEIEVSADRRVLVRRTVRLPPPPGIARRQAWIPPGVLDPGIHVLTVALRAPGDREPADDVRDRLATVAALPGVVAIASPADWESRFLVHELASVTDASVQGYAHIGRGRWIGMDDQQPVRSETIRRALQAAELLVLRGSPPTALPPGTPTWRWPAGVGEAQVLDGDWYPAGGVPASPLGGRFGFVTWDSLPPVTGLVPVVPGEAEWVALTARLGRRGAERPLLVGRDSAGARSLVTTGTGLWRWALRGGAALEAYRTFVASGVDWLLGSDALRRREPLTVTPVVERGMPLVFRWAADRPPPEHAEILLTGVDAALRDTLHFDGNGEARLRVAPGVWRWRVPGTAAGVAVIESYSSEIPPAAVTVAPAAAAGGLGLLLVGARDRWWLFALVIGALVGEWAWRIRRGLP